MTEMAEIEAKKYDVFLVHSSDDKDVAIKIKAGLHAKELEVYAHFDEGSSFGIGKPTVNSIMEAVNLSQTVLILLTQNAIKSQWVTFEILLALERSQREGSMCCRLCFVGTSEEEAKSYQTGELKHIPSLKIDFNQEDWADHLYANIKEEKRMEQILPSGNIAVGLVFNYFVGFLRHVLPKVKSKFEESTFYKDHPERVSTKFVILLPSSCVVPAICGGGEGRGPMIKKEGSLSIESGHGDKARHYNPTVYSIELNGEKWFFSGECPAILETMSKLQKQGFVDIDVHLQVERFRITLQELVQHRNNQVCNNSVCFISYDDSLKTPQEVIADRLIQEQQSMSITQAKGPTLQRRVARSSPTHEEEYFASITNTDSQLDQGLADEIMTFLDKKGKRFSNGDPNKLTIQELDKSRWNIFVFSKEALAEPLFQTQFDAAINASINDDQMQVIPVLSKGMKLSEVPPYYKWITLLSSDEPNYIEKLWKVMSSPPVKMTEKIPAGQVYKGVAWAYLLNYLPLALLGKTADGREFKERFEDAMVKYNIDCPCIAKVFVIIPKSCSFPAPGTQFEREVHIGPLEPVVLGFRKFFLQLYKITTSKGQSYCYAREYATPVIAMHEMANTYPFAGLSKQDLFEQTEKFTQYVKEEIGKDKFKKEIGDLQSRLWLVNYDDMSEIDGKKRSMVEALEEEIEICLQTEKTFLRPTKP